jgi:hypothetical protein
MSSQHSDDSSDSLPPASSLPVDDPWQQYAMALDHVTDRLVRITKALRSADVPYALVGGQAVAIWVATRDPAAVRTTKDVDLLIRRDDLGRVRAAGLSVEMDYFETLGVGMLLDRGDPNPRHAVHLIWAGELVRPGLPLPSPDVGDRVTLPGGHEVVSIEGLVRMKLMANRDQDRVHLRDMIDVGLVERDLLAGLPEALATRLESLLDAMGR